MKTVLRWMLVYVVSVMGGTLGADPMSDFISADTNGDEFISIKEFRSHHAQSLKREGWSDPYDQIIRIFNEQDRDGDGLLSFCESRVAVRCSRLKDAFESHGGVLSVEEYMRTTKRMLREMGHYAMRCQVKDEFFDRDLDRNGRLNVDEFIKLPPKAHSRFAGADSNRDHQLDLEEFEVFAVGEDGLRQLKGSPNVRGWIETIFENRDEDEDDYLTRSELYEFPAEREKEFERADVNDDGAIELEEMQVFRCRVTDISLWRDMAADQCRLNFIQRDRNADGQITVSEYFNGPARFGSQVAFFAIK